MLPTFTSKRILFFVNELDFFLSHRKPLAVAARAAGFEVHVAGPQVGAWTWTAGGASAQRELEEAGFVVHHIPFSRSGVSPLQEARTLLAMYRLVRKLQPDIIHNVAMKAVLYGSIAARLVGGRVVVNALTGLGYTFIAQDLKGRFLRGIILRGLRVAFRQRRHRLILQNRDDPRLLLDARVVSMSEISIIRGSGVDMSAFAPAQPGKGVTDPEGEAAGGVRVVLVSRMLWDKGVGEFVTAAREHRKRGGGAQFLLVGGSDAGNPACVPVSQLEEWAREGAVQWLGHRSDIAGILSAADIVCLPSYREGLPKVLIEAAASGCALVASDVPGCREIVRHGENGLLVPVRDGLALAEALWSLVHDAGLRTQMAERGRTLAVRGFSVEQVVRETLSLYGELLA